MKSRKWYDYLWIAELLYFALGFYNILFAWLGMIFFMIMFFNMIFTIYLVSGGSRNLTEIVTLLWTFKLPWSFANHSAVTLWIAQFAFRFYGVMMTSSVPDC